MQGSCSVIMGGLKSIQYQHRQTEDACLQTGHEYRKPICCSHDEHMSVILCDLRSHENPMVVVGAS